jgi:hypothetical protein
LRDVALPGALPEDCVIFLGHKQPMLRQLWHFIFQVVHCFGAWNVVGQMREQVPEHFGAHDLMNPYLGPGLSLKIHIPE